MMSKFTEDKYQKIVSDYLSGMTQKETAEANNTSSDVIARTLAKRNIEIRKYTGERDHTRKWYWDFSFFSKRNSTVAYWAGFLMADGCIVTTSKGGFCLITYIQEKDREHIDRLCDAIGLDHAAIYWRKEGYPGIQLNHYSLGEQLVYWGIVRDKTHNFVEPQVSDDLLPHYLRGWADGDGQIYVNGVGARFTVSGNRKSLEWYAEALKRLGYSGGVGFQARENDNAILYIGGVNQVKDVVELLLVDGNFKLERKWNQRYDPNITTFTHICKECGKFFEVAKYRHEQEPENGQFCSKKCYAIWERRERGVTIVVDGVSKRKCVRCEEYKPKEEWSANKSYCKVCWRDRAREIRARNRLQNVENVESQIL